MIGHPNPSRAREESPLSLRARYGHDQTRNALHGSDRYHTAEREIRFMFSGNITEPIYNGALARDYLKKYVSPVLLKGLTGLCKEKPCDPTVRYSCAIQWNLWSLYTSQCTTVHVCCCHTSGSSGLFIVVITHKQTPVTPHLCMPQPDNCSTNCCSLYHGTSVQCSAAGNLSINRIALQTGSGSNVVNILKLFSSFLCVRVLSLAGLAG